MNLNKHSKTKEKTYAGKPAGKIYSAPEKIYGFCPLLPAMDRNASIIEKTAF